MYRIINANKTVLNVKKEEINTYTQIVRQSDFNVFCSYQNIVGETYIHLNKIGGISTNPIKYIHKVKFLSLLPLFSFFSPSPSLSQSQTALTLALFPSLPHAVVVLPTSPPLLSSHHLPLLHIQSKTTTTFSLFLIHFFLEMIFYSDFFIFATIQQ
jgi:hypothetical protein